jgi:hypothetical protein
MWHSSKHTNNSVQKMHQHDCTYLEPASEKFVFDFQEVAFALFAQERLVDDLEASVVLDVLPASIAVTRQGQGQTTASR